METALYIWLLLLAGSLAFYIAYDRRVRLGKPIYAAHSGIERLYHQLNDSDVQQAIGNALASLMFSANNIVPGPNLAITRHSFPRQLVLGSPDGPKDLQEYDLTRAVLDFHRKTHRPVEETWRDINEQIELFLATKGALRERAPIRKGARSSETLPGLRATIAEVKRDYPLFNEYQLLHYEQLISVFQGEGVEVFEMQGLPLLSLFSDYEDEKGETHHAVVVRADIHPALKEFVLAHELGHWFLHIKNRFAELQIGKNYYLHSSTEWSPLEFAADAFAMTALFPTPYLAEWEMFHGALLPDRLLAEFTKGMGVPVRPNLKATMIHYLDRRIRRFTDFRNKLVPVKIPIRSIPEQHVSAMLEFFRGAEIDINWVRTNERSLIVDGSDSAFELFGASREDVLDKLRPNDLVVPDEVERLQKIIQRRLEIGRAVFYFTEIKNLRYGGHRRVAVHSFPILSGAVAVGSIGILVPLQSFSPVDYNPDDEISFV